MSNNGAYTKPFTTGATSLEGKEGYSVKVAEGLAELSANSALAIGVVRRGGGIGEQTDIAMPGDIAPVKLAGTAKAGAILAIDSNSKFAASTPSDGDILGAILLEDGVADELKDALIVKATRHEAG